MAPQEPRKPSTRGCVTLFSREPQELARFYRELFGLEPRFQGPRFLELATRDGFRLAIMSAADAPRPAGACGLGFEAPDWEDAGRRLADRGLRADEEEDPVSGVRLLWFEDPEGRPLYFWQLIGDAAEG